MLSDVVGTPEGFVCVVDAFVEKISKQTFSE
jgi:hypothetical protein